MKTIESYEGFELGPIRPPSEASSLMLRVTRNCPWNKCRFCGLYKGEKFSKRPVRHVLNDIDAVRECVDKIQADTRPDDYAGTSPMVYAAAANWFCGGMKSIFLQDANTLIVKPDDLVKILNYLRRSFPSVERITSYARSRTVAKISDDDMGRLAEAGLNRIHIGMESAADQVLSFMRKGVDKKTHILAGQKVKRAGIELSEYFMPGLGGREFSEANARETADALNQIDPDYIRIRTLAIPETTELNADCASGEFHPMGDVEVAQELLRFLQDLEGIGSVVRSDHILNLLEEIDGQLPGDKANMTAPVRRFLGMEADEQVLYIVGRRTGVFSRLDDLQNPDLRTRVKQAMEEYGVTAENVNAFSSAIMKRFI
jgi:histone acetyltransferase (RNA polymerase elongator complex component)